MNVSINNVGEYILFPSMCYHHGYYNNHVNKIIITAQLFARPSINPDTERISQSFTQDSSARLQSRQAGYVNADGTHK
jgi:hypothetical protein